VKLFALRPLLFACPYAARYHATAAGLCR